MKRYNCATCGGELSPYIAEDLFYCNFCGKLYLLGRNPEEESLEELLEDLLEEHSVLEAARKLRLMGKTDVAVALLKDHISKVGAAPLYIRELLLMDINAFAINEYLFMNRFDGPTILKIRQDEYYHMLQECSDPQINELMSEIEVFLDVCEQRDEAVSQREETKKAQIQMSRKIRRRRDSNDNTGFRFDDIEIIIGSLITIAIILFFVGFVRTIPALIVVLLLIGIPLICFWGIIIARKPNDHPKPVMQDTKDEARYYAAITACENAQEKCDAAEAMMEEMMKETYPRIERLEKELFDTETAQ